jgi:methenyltetrahydrofolate cyclohydrolase
MRRVMAGEPIDLWLDALASDLIEPAGEAFAALAGATGAALVGAVARRTLKRLGAEPGGARMIEIQDEADGARDSFLQLADSNAEAYAAFLAILRTAPDTDDARTARLLAMRDALEATIDGQLQIARRSVYLIGLAEEVTRLGDPNTAADGLSAAASLHAATVAALADIEINAFAITEPERKSELAETCASLRGRAGDLLEVVEDAFRLSTETR